MLTLDKSYSFETEHLAVEPIISEEFDLLVSNLTCNAPTRLLVQELELPSTFTGNLLVDNVFHAGNNNTRFTFFKVTSGVIDLETREHIKLDRKSNERVFANNKLRNYPEIVNYSILNSSQKKLLLKGLSI